MSFYQKSFSKILSSSSSTGSRDSTGSTGVEDSGRDEEFYEEIEAPKFVDFTSPDHFRPDDRYWFCERAGCDQKHEKEMDHEAIYNNFVLRVMAARSPNVRYRKILDRNASRSPIKCPLSAPPKSSRPRLSKMALISSISGKIGDDKKRVVRPLLKTGSTTPVMKARPVASKYLTTPRNKKCLPNENSFRSVQNPKPTNTDDVPKNRVVAKALVFRSPKKAVKVKTSTELRTPPVTKLCDGMSQLEISSQKKRTLGYSGNLSKNLNGSASRRPLSSKKVHSEPKEQTSCAKNAAQSAKSNSTTKRKLTEKSDSEKQQVKNEGGECINQELIIKHVGVLQESRLADDTEMSGKCSNVELSVNSTSEVAKEESNSAEMERKRDEFMDSDHNKENASASDENRMQGDGNERQNARKIFGVHDKGGLVKKIVQAPDKPVMKFKKPKPTTLKPFRLRTDERGILKEASLEKRAKNLAPQSESANMSLPGQKLQRKQLKDEPKGERPSKATAALKSEKQKSSTHEQPKPMSTSLGRNSSNKAEKSRKIRSPLRPMSTKKQTISFLVPGQKLDVIPEASPEVPRENVQKPAEIIVSDINSTASRSSSRGRHPVTIPVEPNFHNTHVPRSCTKKLK